MGETKQGKIDGIREDELLEYVNATDKAFRDYDEKLNKLEKEYNSNRASLKENLIEKGE